MIGRGTMITAIAACWVQSAPAGAQVNMSLELDELHDAVVALAASSSRFQADLEDVARLHGAVAALRGGDDPHRFRCLMDQMSFHVAAGQLDAARSTVALAAEQAERAGELSQAADAWVTAALLARAAGDYEAAERARGRAEAIAAFPGLALEESSRIAGRLYSEHWRTATGVPPGD